MQLQIQPSRELDKAGEAVRAGAGIIEVKWRCLTEAHAVEVLGRDNRAGMDEDVQSDIFEPFFSTKEAGKGRGPRLAVVYGTVGQHSGTELAPWRGNHGRLPSVDAAENEG